MISVIIPTYRDEGYLERCLESVRIARQKCKEDIEIMIIYNSPEVGGKLRACNLASLMAEGDILLFLDADSIISPDFLREVEKKSRNDYFVGGGTKWIRFERLSPGIICFLIPILLYCIFRRVTVGTIWVRKKIFLELNGFMRSGLSKFRDKYYDLDFVVRLKHYAKMHGRKFESIKEGNWCLWSTRKFDWYGDWHWLKGYRTEEMGYDS